MDIALSIEALVGEGVKYGGAFEFNTEEEFNKLRWNDERPKPKWVDLVAKWQEIKDIPEPKTELELLQDEINSLKSRMTIQETK